MGMQDVKRAVEDAARLGHGPIDFSSAGIKADVIAESTSAAGVTVDGVLLKDSVVTASLTGNVTGNVTSADLTLTSTNEINVTIGGVSMLAIDDSPIASNTAAAATAGKGCFIETQDGGAATTNGLAGGAISIKTGDGTTVAGAGTTGGAGGNVNLTTGAGAAGSATGTGGAGGTLTLTGGVGGDTSGAGTGGAGGNIVITPGQGGSTVGGTDGSTGQLKFGVSTCFRSNSTGNPAFGTGTGPANATGITAVSKWLVIKDNSNGLFAIPLFGLSA